MNEYNLHQKLTHLLMDNGSAVNKTSIDELIKFIAMRDKEIIAKINTKIAKIDERLDRDTFTNETPIGEEK